MEHKGPPEAVMETVQRFVEWRKKTGLSPKTSATYNILYDDPDVVAAADYRMDICAAIKTEVKENSYGVISKTIPQCRCARLRHLGAWDNLGDSVAALYAGWLPESGHTLGKFPIFVHRVNLFPETPEHELITDIYMPIEPNSAANS